MSVRHNLELGAPQAPPGRRRGLVRRQDPAFLSKLAARLDTPADFLSGGEQQMVAVARALSGARPGAAARRAFRGTRPTIVEELFETFDRLRGEVAMVIVEHNLDLVLALADRAYVLERGTVVHRGARRTALRENLDLRRRGPLDVSRWTRQCSDDRGRPDRPRLGRWSLRAQAGRSGSSTQ